MRRLFLFSFLLLLLLGPSSSALGQDSQPAVAADKEVAKVVNDFWTALGTFDVEGLKQTFDWPVSIVETSASGTKNPRALLMPDDLEKAFKQRPKSDRNEFYGAKLTDFKVQMQNPTLALVTYNATLPGIANAGRESSLTAVAIVRKNPLSQSWKIIFLTVPN